MIEKFLSARYWQVLMFARPYRNHPMGVVYAVCLAICLFISMTNNPDSWPGISKSFYYPLLFFASAMFATVGVERMKSIIGSKKKSMCWSVATQLVLVLECVYMYWQDNLGELHISAPVALFLTAIGSVVLIPMFGHRHDGLLWKDFGELLFNLFASFGLAASFCLCAGIGFILLYFPLSLMTDLQFPFLLVRLICLILPFLVFALNFMRQESMGRMMTKITVRENPFNGLHKMMLLLFSYAMLVMYLYIFIIITSFELPRGYISFICCSLTAFGLLCYMLADKVTPTKGSKTWLKIHARIPWLLLPLQVLVTVAIGRRINDYGVTILRCYIVLINLWSYAICLYLILRRDKSLRWIPTSFLAMLFVFTSTPISCANYVLWQLRKDIRSVINHEENPIYKGIQEDKIQYLHEVYGYDIAKEFLQVEEEVELPVTDEWMYD